jgi:hypothetical protein
VRNVVGIAPLFQGRDFVSHLFSRGAGNNRGKKTKKQKTQNQTNKIQPKQFGTGITELIHESSKHLISKNSQINSNLSLVE